MATTNSLDVVLSSTPMGIGRLRRQGQTGSIACKAFPNGLRPAMKIRNVVHKGLRAFIEDDDVSGLRPDVIVKVRRIISYLQDMEREDELQVVPAWKAHRLAGDRKGAWSLFVTKNWRITFGSSGPKARSWIWILKIITRRSR